MGKKRLADVQMPPRGYEPLVDVAIAERRPVLGMTLLRTDGSYSMDELGKFSRKNRERGVYKELLELQKNMYGFKSMTEFLNSYHTRNGQINAHANTVLKDEIKRIREHFNAELGNDIIHIHCKPLGKGEFTLFGFVYDNVFEVLLFDPGHQIASK